jgi:predicted KAP-like P-loop ATPase
MWADADTDIDFLNYSEVAELVAEMIGREDLLPLSLGIFGTWGTGKSTTLNLVRAELAGSPQDYLVVTFDAWLYQDFDDARAALMAVIARALTEASPPGIVDKARSLAKRVNKLRLLGLAAEGGAAALGLPAFGLLSRSIQAAGDAVSGNADAEDVETLREAGKAALGAGKAASEKAKGVVDNAEPHDPPAEITAFRREFDEILRGLGKTLVVFIDNLDRCLPQNAIHTLEAIRVFLFMPQTAFVVAADEDMVRHAVSQHFGSPGERHVADYLDKLIQVPVRVPRAGVQEVRAYTFLLFAAAAGVGADGREALRTFLIDRLRRSWSPESGFTVDDVLNQLGSSDDATLRTMLGMADRMAPLLAFSARVQGNPRIIKRMLNVVQMRASIARKRRMPLDELIIAKLALFERCTDTSATEAFHDAINTAMDGKPGFLTKIEASDVDPARMKDHCPDSWHVHMDFVRDWVGLEPALGGVDLKPAVYLARETVPLRIVGSALSPNARKAVDVLRVAPSLSSMAARDAIKELDATDRSLVMDRLVAEMRRNPDWSRLRADFRGAVILADAAPEAATGLARFVRSLPLERLPAWMRTMLREKRWFES